MILSNFVEVEAILRPRDCRNGLLAMNVLSSRGHVQFYISNPCAILSTISLFLHEQMHAIQTEEVGTIPRCGMVSM